MENKVIWKTRSYGKQGHMENKVILKKSSIENKVNGKQGNMENKVNGKQSQWKTRSMENKVI